MRSDGFLFAGNWLGLRLTVLLSRGSHRWLPNYTLIKPESTQ